MEVPSRYKVCSTLLIILSAVFALNKTAYLLANTVYDCSAQENKDKPTTVEIVLARKWRDNLEEVKQSFTAADDALKVRIKFFPFLDPPLNLGIGKCVSAERARLAIREAIAYNGGVDRLIMQDIMPHHWIKIGSTDTSELTWIPVGPEELARLTNPTLSTDQFHDLYRQLARQKEKRLPFGMGSEKREGP
jgi:hypothetical protein